MTVKLEMSGTEGSLKGGSPSVAGPGAQMFWANPLLSDPWCVI